MLNESDILYRKRLIREINARLIDGKPVYAVHPTTKENRRIKAVTFGKFSKNILVQDLANEKWFPSDRFDDGVNEIVASKE